MNNVALTVTNLEPGIEINILDKDLNDHSKVISSGSSVTFALPPGLYKVNARFNNQTQEHIVELKTHKNTQQKLDTFLLESNAPLPLTEHTSEALRTHCQEVSRTPTVAFGDGGGLFVFSRDLERKDTNPLEGLTLHDIDGNELLNYASLSTANQVEVVSFAAATVALSPGAYRLRTTSSKVSYEQTVIVSGGWQTQLFVTRRELPVLGGNKLLHDLFNASIFLARTGIGFNPKQPDSRTIEIARQSLTQGRTVFPKQWIQDTLTKKSSNPILGLYVAHNLLLRDIQRESQTNYDSIKLIIENLRRLLGTHPDVEALAKTIGFAGEADIASPPMLRQSWNVLLHESKRDVNLIPLKSLGARIAKHVVSGLNGPWLVWESLNENLENDQELSIAETLSVGQDHTINSEFQPQLSLEDIALLVDTKGLPRSVIEAGQYAK
jgi:hypothetical protein